MAEGDKVTRSSATELVQNLDISSLDGDTAKVLLNKILTSLEDVAKMKSSTTTADEQKHVSSPPDEVRRASEILLGMKGVDQSNPALSQGAENRNQTGANKANAPSSSDDLASRTKSAISTLADLCTALRDVEPQVVNEVLPQRYHHLVPSTSAPAVNVVQEVSSRIPVSKVSSEHTAGTETPALPSSVAGAQVPSPKRIFIPGKTTIRPMPDYCRVIFHPSSPDMDNRKRRARTVFSAQQLKRLEEEYKKCSYPDKERRQTVAEATGLTEGCVRIWYQNRRAKDHRLKDSERQREGMSVSSTSQPEMSGNLSSRPVEPVRLPQSETAPPTTLNRAEEAAMEALVNLSSTTSTRTTAANNPQNNLDSAAQSDEALSGFDTKPSVTEGASPCKNKNAASTLEHAKQSTVANLQLAQGIKEQPQIRQTKQDSNSKLIPAAYTSTIDKQSGDLRSAPSEHVEKTSRTSSQPSQRAMIASLVAQTMRHAEGLDSKRSAVPIAVVNIPIVRLEGNADKCAAGSAKGSEKMKHVPCVAVTARVGPGGSKRGDSPLQSGEVVHRAASIGIPFHALQFQNQWTKKSPTLSQRNDSSTTVTSKIPTNVQISTGNSPCPEATITCTLTSSSASKIPPLLGFFISDAQAKASASSSNKKIQDAKTSAERHEAKAKVSSSDIPSTIVLRLQPRPTTVVVEKPCTNSGKPAKDSEKETNRPTSSTDDCSSSAPGTTDRKRKASEEESVNKVVQTKMWRELKEEKSVAKRTKNTTKVSKKPSPSQMIQPEREGDLYRYETLNKELPIKETTKGSCTQVQGTQTKLSTTDTKCLNKANSNACTVVSDGTSLNSKNSHPTTLHYKKGRICQCHQLQDIIDYCVRMDPETAAKTDNFCSNTKEVGSLQKPREGKGQTGEPVPRSVDSVPKTWTSGTVRHLKITTPISIATTTSIHLSNARSFTRPVGAVPIGSVRAPGITNTQHARVFHRPTPAHFRHINFAKKPCPIPAVVIPKSVPTTGQLFLKNVQKSAVEVKPARGVRVVVCHPSNTVILPTTYTSPSTFTRPTTNAVAHRTCGAAAMFRLGSVLKRPNTSTFRLPLVMKPAERVTAVATTGYTSSGIRLQPVQNRGQPPLPQGDGDALRRLQRFTDGFMERHRSSEPSTESRRDDRPPPPKVRRTDM
ncbi:serine-rich adhesin for platelets-like [Branchiostoma floridae]|uniref:Serine-rich adhesin for platelets-like n=1 Tax=Branchiostoma floridae TaxID=7739 RepID=A0A9J7M9J2_BRAFL|nr:serine-rich adhesin for platelets-like [Branchiostoma floridae]